ncbi:hypothetical protein EB118_19350 [bacterium]|nr:hypothetical protein [bacterium]
MINISLTVREAMWIISKIESYDTIYDKIVAAFQDATHENRHKTVTITGGMTFDNRIPCIKAIRLNTGWGLKESKEWTDVLVGKWDDAGRRLKGASRHSMTLKTPEAAENLLRDLIALGCEGYLS